MSDAMKCSRGGFGWRLHELRQVGGGVARVDAPAIVIDAGLTFRMTLWAPASDRDGRLPIVSEAGALVAQSAELDESAVLDVLRRRRGQISVSQVSCAGGLVELHRAICGLRGVAAARLGAREIAAQAVSAESPECARAMAMFCGLLGDVAGRAALTTSAAGGVFVSGELVASLGDGFQRSPFRRRFEACAGDGRALRGIPTSVVLREVPHASTASGEPISIDWA